MVHVELLGPLTYLLHPFCLVHSKRLLEHPPTPPTHFRTCQKWLLSFKELTASWEHKHVHIKLNNNIPTKNQRLGIKKMLQNFGGKRVFKEVSGSLSGGKGRIWLEIEGLGASKDKTLMGANT